MIVSRDNDWASAVRIWLQVKVKFNQWPGIGFLLEWIDPILTPMTELDSVAVASRFQIDASALTPH